jgi:hypothetical protein
MAASFSLVGLPFGAGSITGGGGKLLGIFAFGVANQSTDRKGSVLERFVTSVPRLPMNDALAFRCILQYEDVGGLYAAECARRILSPDWQGHQG